jgi:FixJ family two-component response regulator
MTDKMFTVFLVDDNAGMLRALSRLLRVRGYDTQSFTSPQAFLTNHDASNQVALFSTSPWPGLQQALTAGGFQRPVIFLTGRGNIPTSAAHEVCR